MTTETQFEIQNQQFELGSLELSDVDPLMEVSRQWVKDRFTGDVVEGELGEIKSRMLGSLESTEYRYFVVRDEKQNAIGCCAIREPEEKMQRYKSTPTSKSVELINVFLDNKYRGKGLGYKLMSYLFEKAKELGNEEVIWNSGPRYKDSAWEFYTKLVGKPIAIATAYYGYAPNGDSSDAPVWRKKLL
jgi:GNAT superfamily N-acetyltransferase